MICRRFGLVFVELALLLTCACSRKGPKPEKFSRPLVQLERLDGPIPRLHTEEIRYRPSDGLLFQCGYSFGVIDAKDPAHMRYLTGILRHQVPGNHAKARLDGASETAPWQPPGCHHVAWDG